MALFTGGSLPWIDERFIDSDGNPLAGGKLYSYRAGTSTPLPTWTTPDFQPATENTNPIILTAGGKPPFTPVFLENTGYKFQLTDANDVPVDGYPADFVEDLGGTFAANFGVIQSQGSKNVTSGFTLLSTDRLDTVSSTGGANPCLFNLLPAQTATQQVIVQNVGTIDVAITPSGADTINSVAAAYTLTAGTSPVFSAVLLIPDGISNWTALLFAS